MSECPICFESIDINNKTILNCDHIFCIECVNKIINNNNTGNYHCPICREEIKEYKNNNILTKLLKKVNITYNINITNDIVKKVKEKYNKIIFKNNLAWIFLLFSMCYYQYYYNYYINYQLNNCEKNLTNLYDELNTKENVYIENSYNIKRFCSIPFIYLKSCFN